MENQIKLQLEVSEISDGYHNFYELYEHRVILFIALMKSHPEISWRANNNSDGSTWEDWFVAGMHLPTGDISYHIPAKLWDTLDNYRIKTSMNAPDWDGHTSNDVLDRLQNWKIKKD